MYNEKYKDENVSACVVLDLIDPLLGHTLYLDNWYTSPRLVDKSVKNKIDCVGTKKIAKLKKGEITAAFRGKQMVIKWKDKRDVIMVNTFPGTEMLEEKRNGKNDADGRDNEACLVPKILLVQLSAMEWEVPLRILLRGRYKTGRVKPVEEELRILWRRKAKEKLKKGEEQKSIREEFNEWKKGIITVLEQEVGTINKKEARKSWINHNMMEKMEERWKWKGVNSEQDRRQYRKITNVVLK
ncbi:hypothetical protein J437_LFUL018274 [Ladona fulva]|uniref:PiggyBac transposable element-derived protein domain-containing protein n=1 Tax=Ladona fulva TaxID=123851 RepID=A0A8K0KRG0_LADFU|nr:hypothetical protein J437_LFUL018274 [Ladona fulva]